MIEERAPRGNVESEVDRRHRTTSFEGRESTARETWLENEFCDPRIPPCIHAFPMESRLLNRALPFRLRRKRGTCYSVGGMATLTIDDFKKVDLRIGTIVTASPHPRADRLLVLEVDLGEERRQLVAGIRAHYPPDDLVGKQVVVVANLAPVNLRGVESQGMILAASDGDGHLTLIVPQHPMAAGSTVR